MDEKDEWVHYKEIEWNDPKFNRFNVDNRDFHCGYNFKEEQHKDFDTLTKYKDKFFHTEEELKETLDRLFNESGGDGEWRCLELFSSDWAVKNWYLKYLRIWRTEQGFIICNSDHYALNKSVLSCEVNKELLSKH